MTIIKNKNEALCSKTAEDLVFRDIVNVVVKQVYNFSGYYAGLLCTGILLKQRKEQR